MRGILLECATSCARTLLVSYIIVSLYMILNVRGERIVGSAASLVEQWLELRRRPDCV
jgi:hypothetical protein